jgi:hypothetical protein
MNDSIGKVMFCSVVDEPFPDSKHAVQSRLSMEEVRMMAAAKTS